MAEASDPLELSAVLDDVKFPVDDRPKTINDLPKELLVSICEAVDDEIWVRHTFPLVCKEWAEIYRTKDASPLHETLEVDFVKEVESTAAREGGPRRGLRPVTRSAAQDWALRRPVVHASRIISWAERRAGSVRKLRLETSAFSALLEDFSGKDLGALVAVVGPSLTEISVDCGFNMQPGDLDPFWEALRDIVVPARRLRSFVVSDVDVSESHVEPLRQLAGSLEELVLDTPDFNDSEFDDFGSGGLERFPEFFCDLTELRRLELFGQFLVTAIPAKISSLKKLEKLTLDCNLSSLPKELGELSGLTRLSLYDSKNLGNMPQDVAFPAELGRMKSLRLLGLSGCGLRAVPAFAGELKSLEILDLSGNNARIYARLDILIKGCPRLRKVRLNEVPYKAPWTPESLAHLEAFKAKLLAENPNAKVSN